MKGLLVHTKGVNNMDDLQIIELYFARDEHAIKETDHKYGKLCFRVANNLLFNSMWTENFQMFKLDLEKAEETEIKLPTSARPL